jgi:hypothetical protein
VTGCIFLYRIGCGGVRSWGLHPQIAILIVEDGTLEQGDLKVKKTIWQPLVLGIVFGMLAGLATATGLSFLTAGITENSIGFYVTLFLLAAALGGPLAGAVAPVFWMVTGILFGPPDVKAIITIPAVFWSNLLGLVPYLVLVGFAYRMIFERLRLPVRLLAWAGIIIAYYFFSLPTSIIPQYLLLENPRSEILPAVLYSYQTYLPQAIFDIFITCLIFIALPVRYSRPVWYESKNVPERSGEDKGE